MGSELINLCLRLACSEDLEIAGTVLYRYYGELADQLIDDEWIIPSGIVRGINTDEGQYMPLFWCDERESYYYFCSYQWHYISKRKATQYRLNMPKLMRFMTNGLNLSGKPQSSAPSDFWYLGVKESQETRFHYYFINARCAILPDPDVNRLLKEEAIRKPAIYITQQTDLWTDSPFDEGQKLVGTLLLQDQSTSDFQFDASVLHNIHSQLVETVAPAINCKSVIEFNEDYRTCVWHGQTYKFTKKQAAIIEELDKHQGKVQGDYLCAQADTNQSVYKIMRYRKEGQWETHPLMGKLIKDDGNAFYYIDREAKPDP